MHYQAIDIAVSLFLRKHSIELEYVRFEAKHCYSFDFINKYFVLLCYTVCSVGMDMHFLESQCALQTI